MAYEIRSEKGIPIKKDGDPVLAMDNVEIKIEKLDEKNISFIAVASTEHEDRDKDIIRQDGWKLTNFKKNPVIPWSHNYYGIPVAKSLKTWIDKTKPNEPRLLFQPKFDAEDQESVKVFNKYKNGFLTSFSVGFRGIDFTFRDEDDRWWGGREFTKQELLEISSVAIPANPHANTRLNYTGGNRPENLIQMGYPEVFAKTNSGLFYPVMDIAIFTQPKEFEIEKGVIGIKAVSLDEEIKVSNPVAYIFDPELFDDKSANEWVNENVERKWTVKYFDLQPDEKSGFSLECVTSEDDIKTFENSIDFIDNKESDIDTDIKVEDDKSIQEGQQKDTDSTETKVSDSKDDDKNSNESATEDKSDGEGNDTNVDSNDASSFKIVDDEIAIPVKTTVQIVTTIKDSDDEIIDRELRTIASNREFKSVEEFNEWNNNKLISLLKDEIKLLNDQIIEISNKKTVANARKTDDNDIDKSDDDLENKSSSNDDVIELDESLIKSPDGDSKTDLDTIIEIDETLFEESKSDLKDVVNVTLSDTLRKSLREALRSVSGKID